ncbi:MAG: dihydrofolate reductase, partial [Bacteroidales bacterium]|nr:dihydrofolate reductase [Bacteroidales bacterium]
MQKNISAIVAIASDGAIGKNGDLLWHLSADLKHFKAITMGHSIVMGRTTFESFPKGALPGRQNIVITRNAQYHPEGTTIAHSIEEAIAAAEMPGEVMIIGGAQIYAATLPMVDTIYLTRVHANFPDADAHFPALNPEEWEETEV